MRDPSSGRWQAMRRLRAPVEVVVGPGGAPVSFRWRGRRHAVRAVVAHWVEAVPWWLRHGAGGQACTWRVEAVTRAGTPGMYDLVRVERADSGAWVLARVID